jgi:hypothetical protein
MENLKKMVEDWYAVESERDYGHSLYTQAQIFKAFAAEIEANKEEIETLKAQANIVKLDQNPDLT